VGQVKTHVGITTGGASIINFEKSWLPVRKIVLQEELLWKCTVSLILEAFDFFTVTHNETDSNLCFFRALIKA
jgi:hypothetical protein